ncbi:MAG: M23 family metallopeptidase [Pacificimonas sp.]
MMVVGRVFVILGLAALVAACTPPEGPRVSPIATTPPPQAAAAPPIRPRWQPTEVVTDARRIEATDYVVGSGDSLSVIAERTGSSVRAIANANGISPPYTIFPGDQLDIPGGRYHSVNRGETGIAIALAYRTDWDLIVAANDLRAPFLLRVGQKLLLPDDAPPQRAEDTRGPIATAAAFDIDIDDIISGGEPAGDAVVAADEGDDPALAVARRNEPPPPFDGRFTWPVNGKLVSRFGKKAGGLYNDGINIAAPRGTPVLATATGTVIYAGNGIPGFGNLVLIKHSDSWVSAYAHNDAFYVERGDEVGRGDQIAEVGSTGSVTDPQLHFELRQGRKAVDPRQHLPAA